MILDELIKATKLNDPKEKLTLGIPKDLEVLYTVRASVRRKLY
jgi:hypothetical protein